jgi:hypothetical protein
MAKNVGKWDRIIRLIVAAVIVILYLAGAVSGWLGIVLLIVALVLAVTAAVGVCPLYKLLGIKTN